MQEDLMHDGSFGSIRKMNMSRQVTATFGFPVIEMVFIFFSRYIVDLGEEAHPQIGILLILISARVLRLCVKLTGPKFEER